MTVPENISLNSITTSFLGGFHQLRPHRRNTAGVVNGGGDEELAAAVDDERAGIVGDIAR